MKGGSQPPVSQARHPSQSGIRAPTANPNRRSRLLNRKGVESSYLPGIEVAAEWRCIGTQQTTQQLNRLLKSLPTLFEGNSRQGIVASRRPRTDANDEASPRQDIDCGQCLGQRGGTSHHRKGSSRHQADPVRTGEDGCQCYEAIQERTRVDQMVVGTQGRETKTFRCLGRTHQISEREGALSKGHSW